MSDLMIFVMKVYKTNYTVGYSWYQIETHITAKVMHVFSSTCVFLTTSGISTLCRFTLSLPNPDLYHVFWAYYLHLKVVLSASRLYTP